MWSVEFRPSAVVSYTVYSASVVSACIERSRVRSSGMYVPKSSSLRWTAVVPEIDAYKKVSQRTGESSPERDD